MTWQKDLQKNHKTGKDLQELLRLTDEEVQRMDDILEQFPMSIPDYYLSLIDPNDENDPIRKMSVPSVMETDLSGSFDTSGEAGNTVIDGMQHKYKETALVLSTSKCAMYCRHCFRKRLVGLSDDEIARHYNEMSEYVREHKEISNVLISGGDSFLNSNRRIEELLKLFVDIEHVDFIRFGTRTPVVLPQRISEDKELLEILKKYNAKKQIYIITHFNHPKEFTEEAKKAVKAIQDIGIPVKNQTVLLKDVNDSPEVLGKVLKMLTSWGIVPYYVFQCRPVSGVKNQFQIPLKKGYEIVEKAKSFQNGLGKAFTYAFSHVTGKIEVAGILPNGEMIFKYHEAKNEKDASRVFVQEVAEDQCWLDEVK